MYSRMEKFHGRKAQRFSIRKYSFGAASVLLGTALFLGANGVRADEATPSVNPATSGLSNSDKNVSGSTLSTPVVEKLPELKIDAVKADENAEVKEESKNEVTTVAEKEVTEATTDKTDKKTETDVKEKSDKEHADKTEADKEKTEKVETEKAQDDVKTVLTQLTSEADVMATVASNFSDKEVTGVEDKQNLSAAITAVKLEATASKELLLSDASKDQMVAQVNRLSDAIEAVYAEMKRAGHAGKVEAVLDDATTQDQKIVGKDVVKDGQKVKSVTNGYITMNADNTAPKAWGFDSTFDTSDLQAGDITKIEVTNLAEFGAAFPVGKEITAADGTVIGKVKSIDYKTSTGNNNNKSVPYWAQRTQRGMTYDERVAEQPAIANETGTYTYNIEWNEKAKDYPNISFGAENLSGGGYLAPQISKDTDYKATIKIDGRTVVEHTYTRKGQQATFSKQGTSASLRTNNGLGYVSNELKSKSDTLEINTDSDIRYGVGSKFTIKLPNSEFTEFKELEGSTNFVNGLNTASTLNPNKGDSITYRLANRWANVKANENNVWILQDGREGGFTLTPK
ncbi:YSIRK-type signal peptide-containing protein, partial [Streptococcus vestibularis]